MAVTPMNESVRAGARTAAHISQEMAYVSRTTAMDELRNKFACAKNPATSHAGGRWSKTVAIGLGLGLKRVADHRK